MTTTTLLNLMCFIVTTTTTSITTTTSTTTSTTATSTFSTTTTTSTTSTTSTTQPSTGHVFHVSAPGPISPTLDILQPGDTLILGDGDYTEHLTPHLSGQPGLPITMRAEHDGMASISGGSTSIPLQMQGVSYWDIEGIVFHDSNHAVIWLVDSNENGTGVLSTHNVFRRVSAYNIAGTGNDHIIEVDWSTNNLFEDFISAGRGRTPLSNFGSDHNTFRRGWLRGDEGTGANCGSNSAMVNYLSHDSTFENIVAAEHVSNPGPCAPFRDVIDWANQYDGPPIVNNRYFGMVSTDMSLRSYDIDSVEFRETGNHLFENSVGLFDGTNQGEGIEDQSGYNVTWDHMTMIGNNNAFIGFDMRASLGCSDPRCNGTGYYFPYTATLTNSIVQGFSSALQVTTHDATNPCLVHSNNILQGIITFDATANTTINKTGAPCTGTKGLDPTESTTPFPFDLATYGRGAYLKGVPGTLGAHVIFEYVDGALTTTPLWPWPMEDRVWNETARYTRQQQSATWAGANGRTGGYWKTLAGVY